MHYGKYTFSANGKPTLTPLFDPKGTMGQRVDFSLLDVWKINKLYQCTGSKFFFLCNNIVNVGVKHQPINQSINQSIVLI